MAEQGGGQIKVGLAHCRVAIQSDTAARIRYEQRHMLSRAGGVPTGSSDGAAFLPASTCAAASLSHQAEHVAPTKWKVMLSTEGTSSAAPSAPAGGGRSGDAVHSNRWRPWATARQRGGMCTFSNAAWHFRKDGQRREGASARCRAGSVRHCVARLWAEPFLSSTHIDRLLTCLRPAQLPFPVRSHLHRTRG